MTSTPDPANQSAVDAAVLADGMVSLTWPDGLRQDLHPACLRHSPGFPGGARPAGPAGRFPPVSSGLIPRKAALDEGGELRLEWQPDGVESVHSLAWLRAQFEQQRLRSAGVPRQVIWDAASIANLSEPAYASLCDDESARMQLFDQVLNWGLSRIREVPQQPGIVESVAGWFGQLQPNPYADDPARPIISSIRVDPTTPVATHQSHFLGPHTDTCWRQTLIGLLFMHCLEAHPEGGRSMLVDGFAVAERLRREAPEAFELLSTVPISFAAVVSDQDQWSAQGRVISVSVDGVVEGIRYNGNSIDQLDCPQHMLEPMYAALEHFERILYDRDLWWRPLLEPGDLLVIDNHRILHGREAFEPTAGQRHLQCCNVERDDFHNRYRRRARQAGVTDWARRLSAGVI